MTVEIIQGDALDVLRGLSAESVNCCVTSPPYWGLRDYGHGGQLGLERTPPEYVAKMVAVFSEVRRVLRDDGTLWLNLGDSYNAYNAASGPGGGFSKGAACDTERPKLESGYGLRWKGLKPKDLVGIPWRVAMALQDDGWYLRQDIIWHKPNPMPESVTDRCTKSHEYIFLLAKSERYYYNAEAIQEPIAASSIERLSQPNLENQNGSDRVQGKTNGPMKAVGRVRKRSSTFKQAGSQDDAFGSHNKGAEEIICDGNRNKRSVWTVTTKPYKAAHFATFPPDLILPCILAGCPEGGTVLDPFLGSGTTALVADRNGCNCIGIELNPGYVKLAKKRVQQKTIFTD